MSRLTSPARATSSSAIAGQHALEATQHELEELEHTEAFELFEKQLALLRKRLLTDPQAFRQMFISDGMQAIAWEFQQDELGAEFTRTLWKLLLRDDDMSTVLHALRLERAAQVQAQVHPRHRRAPVGPLPDVQGPVGGLAGGELHPALHPPAPRSARTTSASSTRATSATWTLGYTPREVDLFVWLEVLRDKQCEDRPCELGVLHRRASRAQGRLPGQDPHPRDAGPARARAGSARRSN